MSEEQYIKFIEDKAEELTNNSFELHAFVAEHSPELTSAELDARVAELEGYYIEIEHYVNVVLADQLRALVGEYMESKYSIIEYAHN